MRVAASHCSHLEEVDVALAEVLWMRDVVEHSTGIVDLYEVETEGMFVDLLANPSETRLVAASEDLTDPGVQVPFIGFNSQLSFFKWHVSVHISQLPCRT